MRTHLDGGLRYHDRGFAGLPQQSVASAKSAEERVELSIRRIGEVGDLVDDTLLLGPAGTASALLTKEGHHAFRR